MIFPLRFLLLILFACFCVVPCRSEVASVENEKENIVTAISKNIDNERYPPEREQRHDTMKQEYFDSDDDEMKNNINHDRNNNKSILTNNDEATLRSSSENQKSLQPPLHSSSPVSLSSMSSDSMKMSADKIEDSLYDAFSRDYSCSEDSGDCWAPPPSTIETEETIAITCDTPEAEMEDSIAGGDEDEKEGTGITSTEKNEQQCSSEQQQQQQKKVVTDKHWGSDPNILRMRDKLRELGSVSTTEPEEEPNNNNKSTKQSMKGNKNQRPPIFLLPGLASTRLVAWKFKGCQHPLLSDIKVQDYVWLNLNIMLQVSTIDAVCFQECLTLGYNQSDSNNGSTGCKLRPDEGLDAISSLAPSGVQSNLMIGGTNTVYAWLIQWLADNLGYDVSNIVGLPYDWRLSPDKTESRDGFLTFVRKRIEAAVITSGEPGIMVAHSMGNSLFRYFLEWLRQQMRNEAYNKYKKQAQKRRKAAAAAAAVQMAASAAGSKQQSQVFGVSWMDGVVSGLDDFWSTYFTESHPPTYTTTGTSPDRTDNNDDVNDDEEKKRKHEQDKLNSKLWELAKIEGDDNWYEWIETHIWTYVGLSAPLLGAVNPLRAVLSGENMGLPIQDDKARSLELSFGSTHTLNPLSLKGAFCDQMEVDDWGEEPEKSNDINNDDSDGDEKKKSRLACLDDLWNEIELYSNNPKEPWKNFETLRQLLRDRVDWDSDFPMIQIALEELCQTNKGGGKPKVCNHFNVSIGPSDVETGEIFNYFSKTWKEKDNPLLIKREQLRESYWDTNVPNILNHTWDRPLIKHIIMAYGVDMPTEVGYKYVKKYDRIVNKDTEKIAEADGAKKEDQDIKYDGIPTLSRVLWEGQNGAILEEKIDSSRGSLTDILVKKKQKRERIGDGRFQHSGDGSVPYLSLAWAQTWLLHFARAMRHDSTTSSYYNQNPLDDIAISHRPKGAIEWVEGPRPSSEATSDSNQDVDIDNTDDTGTDHPHGTKYKPEMVRYHNVGISRTTGIEYTTTVIEAIGVEHKETTRNYDILAAVFTEVLKNMDSDFGI